jgi:hypothetical protein
MLSPPPGDRPSRDPISSIPAALRMVGEAPDPTRGRCNGNNDPAWFLRSADLSPRHDPAFLATRGAVARNPRWIVISQKTTLDRYSALAGVSRR